MSFENRLAILCNERDSISTKITDCNLRLQIEKNILKKYQKKFILSLNKTGFWDKSYVDDIVRIKRNLNIQKNEANKLINQHDEKNNIITTLISFRITFDMECILPSCLKKIIIDYC